MKTCHELLTAPCRSHEAAQLTKTRQPSKVLFLFPLKLHFPLKELSHVASWMNKCYKRQNFWHEVFSFHFTFSFWAQLLFQNLSQNATRVDAFEKNSRWPLSVGLNLLINTSLNHICEITNFGGGNSSFIWYFLIMYSHEENCDTNEHDRFTVVSSQRHHSSVICYGSGSQICMPFKNFWNIRYFELNLNGVHLNRFSVNIIVINFTKI